MEKMSLYMGSSPESVQVDGKLLHLPLTEMVYRDFNAFSIRSAFDDICEYTHIIFASKNSVHAFFKALAFFGYKKDLLADRVCVAVGDHVAKELELFGIAPRIQIRDVSQEGIAHELELLDLETTYVLILCSSRHRPYLKHILMLRDVRHQFCALYDVICKKITNPPNLDAVEEIIFSSPACVEAFMTNYGAIPKNKKLTCSGPITKISLALSHIPK